jgi:hypothetical protein
MYQHDQDKCVHEFARRGDLCPKCGARKCRTCGGTGKVWVKERNVIPRYNSLTPDDFATKSCNECLRGGKPWLLEPDAALVDLNKVAEEFGLYFVAISTKFYADEWHKYFSSTSPTDQVTLEALADRLEDAYSPWAEEIRRDIRRRPADPDAKPQIIRYCICGPLNQLSTETKSDP